MTCATSATTHTHTHTRRVRLQVILLLLLCSVAKNRCVTIFRRFLPETDARRRTAVSLCFSLSRSHLPAGTSNTVYNIVVRHMFVIIVPNVTWFGNTFALRRRGRDLLREKTIVMGTTTAALVNRVPNDEIFSVSRDSKATEYSKLILDVLESLYRSMI